MSVVSPPPVTFTDIRNRLFGNSAIMMSCRMATVIMAIVIIPLITGRVGVEGYGTWEVILATAMLCAIGQSSIRDTLLWRIATAYGNHDIPEMRRYFRLGITIVSVQFCVALPLVFLFRHDLMRVFQVSPAFWGATEILLPCTTALIILSGINECLNAVIIGHQRAGTATIIQLLVQLGNYAGVILGLTFGLQLSSMMLGLAVAQSITFVVMFIIANRLVGGGLVPLPHMPRREELKVFLPYLGLMLIGALTIALRDQTTKIISASVATPVWTGYYGIANRIAVTILMMLTFFSIPAFAGFGALQAAGDWDGVKRLYLNVVSYSAVLAGMVVVTIAGLYDRIMVLWLGKYIPQVIPILLLLTVGNTFATMLTGVGAVLCKGIGRPMIEIKYILVSLALNIVLLATLVPTMGPMGAVIANVVSWGVAACYFSYLLHREVDLPMAEYRIMLQTVGAVLVAIVVTRLIAVRIPLETTRASAGLSFLWMGAIAMAIYWGIVLITKRFHVIRGAAAKVFDRVA